MSISGGLLGSCEMTEWLVFIDHHIDTVIAALVVLLVARMFKVRRSF